MVFVDLSHGEGHAGQAALVDEQVESLRGQQSHPVPDGDRRENTEQLMGDLLSAGNYSSLEGTIVSLNILITLGTSLSSQWKKN